MGERTVNIAIESQGISFEREDHSYRKPDGTQVISATQVLKLSGAINYDGIPPAILAHAAWRGTLVHEATALYDKGQDVESLYEMPEEILPYYRAWQAFVQEFDFIPDVDEIERPRVVTVSGIEYAMTPDVPGLMRGIPTVIEKKTTVAKHPCWGLQLAAYEAGLKRPKGYRNYQRVAVQLKPDGTFKPHLFEDPSDFSVFASMHATVAWKLNNRLIKLAA